MYLDLGQRERQILDSLYRRGRATVAEVLEDLADPPSYSAVRTMLGKLEKKGRVRHVQDGARYVYLPAVAKRSAQTTALRRILNSLFNGSTERTVAALLDVAGDRLTDEDLGRIEQMVAERRRGQKRKARG